MIFPDDPEVMTYFVRCTEVTSNLTTPSLKCLTRFAVSGRASPVAGRAAPLTLACRQGWSGVGYLPWPDVSHAWPR